MCLIVVASFLLHLSRVYSYPVLEPQTYYVCPNTTITYTCQDSNITTMQWYAEPYFSGNQAISYGVGLDINMVMHRHMGSFYSKMTHVNEDLDNSVFVNLTTILVVNFNEDIANEEINISCITRKKESSFQFPSSLTIYLAGIPRWKNPTIIYQDHSYFVIAVLVLGEIFDVGGVPIDHYIIQLDNGTQLETTNSTYSFDIMYNTTLSVNISAHNCAGYSPFFPLVIQYRPVREDIKSETQHTPTPTPQSTPTPQPTIHTPARNNRNISTLEILLIIYSSVVSAIACIPPVYLIVKCFNEKWATVTVQTQNKVVNLEENTAYGVTVSRPDYNMENNPIYETRAVPKESDQKAEKLPLYELVDVA